ncbi:N-acetyl-D-glucosamine ABC transport system, sugar-binding protein [Lachnospiraceae bacterium KM106-2]|nr:N-acetyl-D-glucosamine ABC transport system, sugar-binding protein [Lachnospiraceae bacterium KM106-2]
MRIRKTIAMLVGILVVFSLAGCGKKEAGGNSAKKDGGVVTLNFYEHSDSKAIAQDLVDAYNKSQKKVKVKLSLIANDDYDDKIKVMLSGGSDIDCFWIRGGSQARQFAQQGALLPLDDMMKSENVDISKYGKMGNTFQHNGKNYGLCTSKSCWLLWYNKDLFDKAGEKYPINLTWDQYTALAKKLTKKGYYGGVCPNWTMNLGATAVGEYLTDKNLTKTMEYAKYQKAWYQDDKSSPSIEEQSGSFDLNAFFAEGKTYMMINGDWEFLTFPDAKPNFTWCAAPLPIFDGAEAESTVGSSGAFSVAAKSKHQKEAFDFIKFCCYSDEGATIYAKNSAVPAYPSDAALKEYKKKVKVPGAEYVFSAKVGLEQGLDANYEEINTAFKEELNDSLVGNCSLDQAFKKFKQRRDEINAK